MKKLFILLILFSMATEAIANIKEFEIIPKIGISPYSSLNSKLTVVSAAFPNSRFDSESDNDTSTGFSISAEGFAFFTRVFALGAGVSYFFNRTIDNVGDFSFTNLYLAAKLKFSLSDYDETNPLFLYAVAHLGLSFFSHDFELADIPLKTNDKGYYALGAGLQIKSFIIELLYSCNNAYIEGNGYIIDSSSTAWEAYGQEDEVYTALTLNIGYRFKL